MRTDPRREYFALLAMYRIVRMGELPFLVKRLQQMSPIQGPEKDLVIPSVTNFPAENPAGISAEEKI